MSTDLIRKLQELGKGVICEYVPQEGLWVVRNYEYTRFCPELSGWSLSGGRFNFEHPDLEVAIQSFLDMAGGK